MVYVALLRGINVGGNNIIDMKLLKKTFEKAGMEAVVTYINSGNVVFTDTVHTKQELSALLGKAIYDEFQLNIKVLIRDMNDFERMMEILSESWRNDEVMKCDVLFLEDSFDREDLLSELTIKPSIDTAIYSPGAILWSVAKKDVTRSGLIKIVGTPLYKAMTVRNVNTVRKLYEIMRGQA